MNKKSLISIMLLTSSLGLYATNANAQGGHRVDCDSGDSIQAAIDKRKGHAGPITINVKGTCEESIFILRDDVTIDGNDNATIIGTIETWGGNRNFIKNIKLTNSGVVIDIYQNSNLNLDNVTVTGSQNPNQAIGVAESSSLNIENSNVSNNIGGIAINTSSSAWIRNTVISQNSANGLMVRANSSVNIIGGTSIEGNNTGVIVDQHAFVTLSEDSNVSNNFANGVYLQRDAAILVLGGGTINNNGANGIFCVDTESSYENDGGTIDTVNCTDFNQ